MLSFKNKKRHALKFMEMMHGITFCSTSGYSESRPLQQETQRYSNRCHYIQHANHNRLRGLGLEMLHTLTAPINFL